MYVSMQVIGNALTGNRGWNGRGGQSAEYELSGAVNKIVFYEWKPDMSVCPGSGGLLLSTAIEQYSFNTLDGEGALMLWFDAEAVLLSAQFDTTNARDGAKYSSGTVTGSNPAAVGAEIQRRIPSETYFNMGEAANHSVKALASGVYKHCKITSINSGKVLDIAQDSTQDGGKLIQWQFKGSPNQLWRLVPVSPDSYIIVSLNSSKALDVPGTDNGVEIIQWGYHGGSNQHWRVVEIGSNDYKIESVSSGKVLDVKDFSTSDGAPIQQWSYNGTPHQRWRIDGV